MYTCASAFVSFLIFLVILAIYICTDPNTKRCWARIKQTAAKNAKSHTDIELSSEGKKTLQSKSYTSTSVNMNELQESLLDSSFV